jgi:hypothetical protein
VCSSDLISMERNSYQNPELLSRTNHPIFKWIDAAMAFSHNENWISSHYDKQLKHNDSVFSSNNNLDNRKSSILSPQQSHNFKSSQHHFIFVILSISPRPSTQNQSILSSRSLNCFVWDFWSWISQTSPFKKSILSIFKQCKQKLTISLFPEIIALSMILQSFGESVNSPLTV